VGGRRYAEETGYPRSAVRLTGATTREYTALHLAQALGHPELARGPTDLTAAGNRPRRALDGHGGRIRIRRYAWFFDAEFDPVAFVIPARERETVQSSGGDQPTTVGASV